MGSFAFQPGPLKSVRKSFTNEGNGEQTECYKPLSYTAHMPWVRPYLNPLLDHQNRVKVVSKQAGVGKKRKKDTKELLVDEKQKFGSKNLEAK